MNPRIIRLFTSILIGIIAAAVIGYGQSHREPQKAAQQDSTVSDNGYVGKKFGGDFAGLTNQNGKMIEASAFAGQYQLVFFGFTHCPAVCPTELQKLTYVLKNMKAAERKKLAVLFVSVDPARDTPDKLKSYISVFDQGITGVTGSQDQIDRLLNNWKVYAAKSPLEGGDYTMDHSAFLYLRGPDGVLEAIFPYEDTPEQLLSGIRSKIIH